MINRGWWDKESDIPFALGAHMTGLDHCSMFLYGQPPLPGSEDYETYVSTLNGRIEPEFLQDNMMGMSGSFAVPFRYGEPGRGCSDYFNYDSDDSHGCGRDEGIGKVWTDEVDAEMRRIESLNAKKITKGKKRKAPSKKS